MAVILEDPTRPRDPSSPHAFPDVVDETELRAPRTLAEDLLARFRAGQAKAEISFELGANGGYARTVTGTIAYLDEETFMVEDRQGQLARVPLRDITSCQELTSYE